MDAPKEERSPLLEKKQIHDEEPPPPVSFWQLFRFATTFDWVFIILGSISAIAFGVSLPAMFVYFGQGINTVTIYGRFSLCGSNYETCLQKNYTTLSRQVWNKAIKPVLKSFNLSSKVPVDALVVVGCIAFATGTLQMFFWNVSSTRQVKTIQIKYFRAILRQSIGFHDLNPSGELNARLSGDITTLKKGIGEKLSLIILYVSLSTSGLIVALVFAWKVSLVALAMTPVVMISAALLYKVNNICKKRETEAYSKAGAIAEETISSVETVASFGCQMKEVERYQLSLDKARKAAMFRGGMFGLCMGLIYFTAYCQYAVSFWFGTTLVLQGQIEPGYMFLSVFTVMLAGWSAGIVSTHIAAIPQARAVAARIYQIIDRVPEIDIFSDEGDEPNPDDVTIQFSDICFNYPARPDAEVLKDISFKIEHGLRVGLVGQSGCGKSTIFQLIQRFYDVKNGSVHIGGKDVKNLNLKKLRDLIGVVSQEPVLFGTTIAENIRWGRTGVSDQEMYKAAKQANAYRFIMKLPEKFDTLVGEAGGQLSGGQKQRIAIARAIARNPKILLLDEATSSLDTHSEAKVQAALDKASEGRTTIVVAHRLSTIRDCDKIIAIHEGQILEQGSHNVLMQNPEGVYRNLVQIQSLRGAEDMDVQTGFASPIMKRKLLEASPQKSFQQSPTKVVEDRKDEKHLVDEEDEEEPNLPQPNFKRMIKMNAEEWPYIVCGCLFAVVAGSGDPLSALIIGGFYSIFEMSDLQTQYHLASLYAGLFAVAGFLSFLGFAFEGASFGKSGMELTMRLRTSVFKSILHQDISFFDERGHGTGTLCHRLAVDASRVQASTGMTVGIMLRNLSSLVIALGLALGFAWKVGLVFFAFTPFIIAGGFLINKMSYETLDKGGAEQGKAASIANEAIMNIRTIATLTKEDYIHTLYANHMMENQRKDSFASAIEGIIYGFSQSTILFGCAAAFAVATDSILSGDANPAGVFIAVIALLFGAFGVGQNSAFLPDFLEARTASARMMALLDRTPTIDAYSTDGIAPVQCKGAVTLKTVSFRYPNRPNAEVLKGIDVSVKPGQTLALVGQSGCGKTTITKLISRFYDVDRNGSVYLDGIDIRELNVAWLRQQIGAVPQEPVLFNRSIKENIEYGDCTREISEEEIKEATEKANAAKFISEFPEGYDTSAGAKGEKLSGGQKQRVAISRALVRNPKILLLDEATSALDSESEKLVQEALDAAREGRTSIVIAHRLSTVRNADQIAVIEDGKVVEVGVHETLLNKKGAYFRLVNAQLN
ncbi:phosphatidylcholine translocator ABCB4-like isoform X2 [Clavelina lepadiformis]|uniref:phosphatidylcholine translocator ABCB4-like isoform X2 n=1 Tax=Clavelina lepadiformis TaxID=159417 RepID=UPI004042837B